MRALILITALLLTACGGGDPEDECQWAPPVTNAGVTVPGHCR